MGASRCPRPPSTFGQWMFTAKHVLHDVLYKTVVANIYEVNQVILIKLDAEDDSDIEDEEELVNEHTTLPTNRDLADDWNTCTLNTRNIAFTGSEKIEVSFDTLNTLPIDYYNIFISDEVIELMIILLAVLTDAICPKCLCRISYQPLCAVQENTGKYRGFNSECVLNCSNKCFRNKYKFLGYGRCGTVRKRIEEEARMRTTTAPTTVIPDIHKMTTRKMPVPVTKNANSISN
ncbi:hypothetical protein QE152_g5372 [Popillia japonica]|uniref:Kazal-like domain-containing protein n=1 Tax=Popillia japonica TaxID=7064 RepID=A0AAW1MPM2_POPJA